MLKIILRSLLLTVLLFFNLPVFAQSVTLSNSEQAWAKRFIEKTVIPQLQNGSKNRQSLVKDIDIKNYPYYNKSGEFNNAMSLYMNSLICEKSDYIAINTYFYSNRNSNYVAAQIVSMREGWSFRYLPKSTEIAPGVTLNTAQRGIALVLQEPSSFHDRSYSTLWRDVNWTGNIVDGRIDGEGAGCYFVMAEDADQWVNGTFFFKGVFENGIPRQVTITRADGKKKMNVSVFSPETQTENSPQGMMINDTMGTLENYHFISHHNWQHPNLFTINTYSNMWGNFLRKEEHLLEVSNDGIATIERSTVFNNDIKFAYQVNDKGDIVGIHDEKTTTKQMEVLIEEYYRWLLGEYAKIPNTPLFSIRSDLNRGQYLTLIRVYQTLIKEKLIQSSSLSPDYVSSVLDLRDVLLNNTKAIEGLTDPNTPKKTFLEYANKSRHAEIEVTSWYQYYKEKMQRPFNSLMQSAFFPKQEHAVQTEIVKNNLDRYLSYLKQQYEEALPIAKERDRQIMAYNAQKAAKSSIMKISENSKTPSGELIRTLFDSSRHYEHEGKIEFSNTSDYEYVSYNIYPDSDQPYQVSTSSLPLKHFYFSNYNEMMNAISDAYYAKYGRN